MLYYYCKVKLILGDDFMNNENNVGIVNFINACNELVNGKFILADIKISKMF